MQAILQHDYMLAVLNRHFQYQNNVKCHFCHDLRHFPILLGHISLLLRYTCPMRYAPRRLLLPRHRRHAAADFLAGIAAAGARASTRFRLHHGDASISRAPKSRYHATFLKCHFAFLIFVDFTQSNAIRSAIFTAPLTFCRRQLIYR